MRTIVTWLKRVGVAYLLSVVAYGISFAGVMLVGLHIKVEAAALAALALGVSSAVSWLAFLSLLYYFGKRKTGTG